MKLVGAGQQSGDIILSNHERHRMLLPQLNDPILLSLYSHLKTSYDKKTGVDRLKQIAEFVKAWLIYDIRTTEKRNVGVVSIASVREGFDYAGTCLEASMLLWGLLKLEGFDANIGIVDLFLQQRPHAWVSVSLGNKRYIVDPLRNNFFGRYVRKAPVGKSIAFANERTVALLREDNNS